MAGPKLETTGFQEGLMRVFLFLISLSLSTSLAPLAFGAANLVPIDFGNLAPLQMEAGSAEASHKAEEWLQMAQDQAAKSGRPLAVEVLAVINQRAPRDFRVYVSPDGKFRPDDGHHKTLAALELMKRFGISPQKIQWQMNVIADFRGQTWDAFGQEMTARKIGYFPEQVLQESRAAGESIGTLFQRMPSDFSKIGNSPMRTSTGALYDALGIEGEYFKPYSQFLLGDVLAREGVRIEPGLERSPTTIKTLQHLLLMDPRGEKLVRFIISMANPAELELVKSSIETARRNFLANEAGFKPDGRIVGPVDSSALGAPLPQDCLFRVFLSN